MSARKSKKVWLIIAVIVVLIAGALAYAVANKDDMPSYSQPDTVNNETANNATTPPEHTDTGTPPENVAAAGKYEDYSEEAFANAEGQRWLFFHAGWCPQCRALEKDILESGVPQGVTIFKVDYDTATELKKKYGVTLQTTVVEVDKNGNEVKKFVAYDDPTIDAVINALGR